MIYVGGSIRVRFAVRQLLSCQRQRGGRGRRMASCHIATLRDVSRQVAGPILLTYMLIADTVLSF